MGEGEEEGDFVWKLVREGDYSVEFMYHPGDRAQISEMLGHLHQDLDYSQILKNANFWVSSRDQGELAQSTSVLRIAESLDDALLSRFNLNLLEILETEGAVPHEGNMDLRFIMVALAACRLGVLFGSNLDPDSIPRRLLKGGTLEEGSLDAREEARVEQERFALLPGEKEKLDTTMDVDQVMREEIRATMVEYERKEKEHREETMRRGWAVLLPIPISY